MPNASVYKLFISHAFSEHEDYTRFVSLLDEYNSIVYSCTSVPTSYKYKNMTKAQLGEQLRAQIRAANCFVVLDAVYQESPDTITAELNAAGRMGIPIIAVKKWKSREISPELAQYAKITTGWNIDSILSALKES